MKNSPNNISRFIPFHAITAAEKLNPDTLQTTSLLFIIIFTALFFFNQVNQHKLFMPKKQFSIVV
jgi:hypothetical protein